MNIIPTILFHLVFYFSYLNIEKKDSIIPVVSYENNQTINDVMYIYNTELRNYDLYKIKKGKK